MVVDLHRRRRMADRVLRLLVDLQVDRCELLSLLCSSMRCCGLGWVGGPLGLPTSRSSFGVFSVVHFSVAVFSCTLS